MTHKIARNIFIVLSVLNGLFAIAIVIMLMANTQYVIESFGVLYTPNTST